MPNVYAQKPAAQMSSGLNLVLDVGGTNVLAGLVDGQGRVLRTLGFATRPQRPPQELLEQMAAVLQRLASEAPDGARPQALAAGLPGCIDRAAGLLVEAPNMPGWHNVPVASLLGQALNLPVFLENDSNLYALGEASYGAGRGLANLLVVTLGTGVGGGLILDGRLWNGSFLSAAEIGHLPLTARGGEKCGCGRRGCLETVASATAMSRQGRAWLKAGRPSLYRGRPEDLTPKEMSLLAAAGDPMSLAVFQRAGRALGQALSAVFNLLGLEAAVLGGGAAGAFVYLEPALRSELSKRLIVAKPQQIKILKAQLGNNAPLAGGAALIQT